MRTNSNNRTYAPFSDVKEDPKKSGQIDEGDNTKED